MQQMSQICGNYAESFTSIQALTVTKVSNWTGFVYNVTQDNTTHIGTVRIGTANSASSANYGVSIIAVGKWK